MKRFSVSLALTAKVHVETIEAWWRIERQAAPALFATELERAMDRLTRLPRTGAVYAPLPGVRRLLPASHWLSRLLRHR